jgi:ubiquinone/menaquinone biosynthesis C-methylase UbiE
MEALEKWRDVWRRFTGRGVYPAELGFLLANPLRRFAQFSPRELAARLELRDDYRVLELGPGPGYFSAEVARRVPRGGLVLCDIQPSMLRQARRRLERVAAANAFLVAADASQLPFRSDSFDVAFLVTVLGEVSDARACLAELYRTTRAGGLLSISEVSTDADFVPLGELRAMVAQAGFRLAHTFGSVTNFTANFLK